MNFKNKLREAIVLPVLFLVCSSQSVHAQIRWDGGGGDNLWTNAANWTGDTLPGPADDVLLDNSMVPGNYIVMLPGGAQIVSIKTLEISPSPANVIEVILPNASSAAPAFIATGPGYGLTIYTGGIFRNASGISSGQSVQIADSIRVNNGGQYIHQSRSSHATAIAQILSRSPGTETGIVEFDVPGTTGYTISASGRVYGTLILSAVSAGTARTYSSSGSNDLLVRGDLRINAGVNYNVNLDGDMIVNRDLINAGNSFNISSGGDSTCLRLKGDWSQTGVVAETSNAEAFIELCGTTIQKVNVTGNINNSVGVRINNPAGAILQSPLVLPWKLELINGRITTSDTNLLQLLPTCMVSADSLSNHSFIDGPVRKEGLSTTNHFLFPVGKGAAMRWLALKNATGSFTVEFFNGDPRMIDTTCGPGINHISRIEYWTVKADSTSPAMANPELSFADPNSGGVTDLSWLRVAQRVDNVWIDAGNSMVTGTAGSRGSVTGNVLTNFSASTKCFTLASANARENPLPIVLIGFGAIVNNGNHLKWTCVNEDIQYFDVLHSRNNRSFKSIGRVYANPFRKRYEFIDKQPGISYYKLKMTNATGFEQESEVIRVAGYTESNLLVFTNSSQLTLTIRNAKQNNITCLIMDAAGHKVRQFSARLSPGNNSIATEISNLGRGVYFLRILNDDGLAETISFMK